MELIELKNQEGQSIKLEAEMCPACKSKVWPSLIEHQRTTCPELKKQVEIFCRRCKGLIKVVDGTKEQMMKYTNYLHVFMCDRCRKIAGKRRRPNQKRATRP